MRRVSHFLSLPHAGFEGSRAKLLRNPSLWHAVSLAGAAVQDLSRWNPLVCR
jgi:hypothetical protein